MSRKLKVFVLLAIFFVVWIVVAPLLANRLIVEKRLEKADAILVLGGSSVYVERTQEAALLYKKGIAPKIFLTDDGERAGWSQEKQTNPPFVELAKESLISQGVPSENIEILSPQVTGTIYEAEILLKKVKDENLDSLLIVTSAYHTKRSLWIFEKVFSDNNLPIKIGIIPAQTGQQTPPPNFWWLTPRGWQLVAGEYVKTLYYWLYY
jgi:uncharacterized SAM-binding protein YcdF (DUF218 family)